MLTRTQLILLTAMSTLGGSFAGLLVVGMIAGDIRLAMINLGLIIAVFCSVFTIGSGSGDKQANKLEVGQKTEGTYFSVDWPHEFTLNGRSRRSSDLHVGGEVLPEFK